MRRLPPRPSPLGLGSRTFPVGKRRWRAVEPGPPVAIKASHCLTLELRQVPLYGEPELRLQVPQVAVALGDRAEQVGIELDPHGRVHGIHAVLLIDRLAPRDRPLAGALLEEIVEPAGAHHVDQLTVAAPALADRHFRLAYRTATLHVHARAAEEVQDAHAFLEPRLAHLDELARRALEPGGGHPAVVVPDGGEAVPVAGVAPQRPVVDHLDDRELVRRQSAFAPDNFTTLAHFTISARRNLSNSSIDMPIGNTPCLAHAAFTSAELMILFASALSFSRTGRGVPAGAINPSQMPDS